MKDVITVKELKEMLSEYEDNQFVYLYGGEGSAGDFAYLGISDTYDDGIVGDGILLMGYEE